MVPGDSSHLGYCWHGSRRWAALPGVGQVCLARREGRWGRLPGTFVLSVWGLQCTELGPAGKVCWEEEAPRFGGKTSSHPATHLDNSLSDRMLSTPTAAAS